MKSGLYVRCGTVRMHHFSKNSLMVCGALLGCKNISLTFLWGCFFFEMGDHFLQDFLVVHCCNSVALIYSILIQKTLFIKKYYHHNLSSTTYNFGFFGGWRCRSFPLWTLLLWFRVVIKYLWLIYRHHIAKYGLSFTWNCICVTRCIQKHDVPFILMWTNAAPTCTTHATSVNHHAKEGMHYQLKCSNIVLVHEQWFFGLLVW